MPVGPHLQGGFVPQSVTRCKQVLCGKQALCVALQTYADGVTVSREYREPVCFDTEFNVQKAR